ncbi:MAG: VWA domain-containing protein [Chitinophagales bacterium]|nr:VWA domain-containing protein [Chitinophagales bacterium]
MDRIERWRMILGKVADPEGEVPLQGDATRMDKVLEALYDSNRKGGLGSSSPNINRWLGDIRRYFPTPIVQMMQRDALNRLQLEQMLLEPELLESIEPDVELVGTILALSKVMPEQTRETARIVVKKIVEQLEKKLSYPMQQAIRGSLNRATKNNRPRQLNEINWHKTIQKNLKHYQPEYKSIIPAQLIGYGRKRSQLKDIFILIDQSGSMATSVVYAGILSCIMASMRAIRLRLIAFDTSVVDLSHHLNDPVDLLFATQLGGGTDIAKAIAYIQPMIQRPKDTIIVLISDLYEGGREADLLRRVARIKESGAQLITLLALSDQGSPSYSRTLAGHFATLDIPSFACTPDQFPSLMAAAIRNDNLHHWMEDR